MKRKEFLIGSSAIALAGALGGCNLFADPKRLRILGLAGAIPSKTLKEFETRYSKPTELKTEATPEAIWKILKETSESDKIPDVASLGDAWLDNAIAQKLISPIDPSGITQWSKLSPVWQQAATRNGQVWGIPYRWGVTAIAYRTDKLSSPITSWIDLWRSELTGKITLPDDAREVIGLVLKKLGQSYKTSDLKAIATLKTDLQQLHTQVLTYTSDTYLQPLLIEDSWVAVGWSQDMIRAVQQNPDLAVVIPSEGTAIWTDMWVIPQKASRPDNQMSTQNWLNFCLEPAIANQITALTASTATNPDVSLLPKSVTSNPIKFPNPQVLAKSELILPLSEITKQEYLQIWENLRKLS
jgi:putative spermidine/putrescine transport system substrate-binding protein